MKYYFLNIIFFLILPLTAFSMIEVVAVPPITTNFSGAVDIIATGSADPFKAPSKVAGRLQVALSPGR
jgi:hypothetical protein